MAHELPYSCTHHVHIYVHVVLLFLPGSFRAVTESCQLSSFQSRTKRWGWVGGFLRQTRGWVPHVSYYVGRLSALVVSKSHLHTSLHSPHFAAPSCRPADT